MAVHHEIAQSHGETGAWSRKGPKHTWNSMSRDWAANPPACTPSEARAGLSQQRIRDCSRSVHG